MHEMAGWHICSTCQRAAHHMCYTCTYSLCKNCTKGADYVCVRGNKGLCGTCFKTIMLIENIRLGNEERVQVDFDDKSSWEYLFKVYWMYLKEKLSLSMHELIQAKNPWKESDMMSNKQVPHRVVYGNNGRKGFGLDDFNRYGAADCSNRRKTKKQVKVVEEEAQSEHLNPIDGGPSSSSNEGIAWASKELLEFVALMRDGNTSILSPLDVQRLLMEYIKRNNLRDPRQKWQILCDSMLFSLFGKAVVGHIEMLKLLESHFLVKDKPRIDGFIQGSVADAVTGPMNIDLNNHNELMVGTDKRRKSRKKIDERVLQANPDDYAAIDVHNIRLIYLERNMIDKLIDDSEKFHEKVIGSFVRIKISGGDQKQDHYRLVQVVDSSRVEETNNTGGKSTSMKFEILNLDKKEAISINEISSQEFSEDECRLLHESIKGGLIKQMTVGEIQRKAMALQEVRVTDWLEKEMVRLNHLRDQASEKGQEKELREFMEKLQLLSSPEERQRRLNEPPDIHVDLSMDPICEAKSDSALPDGNKNATNSHSSRKRRASTSPRRGSSDLRETRSRSQKKKLTDMDGECPSQMPEMIGSSRIQAREASIMSSWKTESLSGVASEISPSPLSTGTEQSVNDVEICKLWHYHDPSGKIQGPFTILQLRKWNENGHFPVDLKIWRTEETIEDSILLTDVLIGRHTKQPSVPPNEIKVSSIDQHNAQEELKSVVTDVSIGEESCIPKESISNSPSRAGKEAFPDGGLGSNLSSLISAIDTISSREENAKDVLPGADLPSNDNNASPVRVQSPQQNESHESSQNNGNPSPPPVIEGQANGGCTNDKQVGGDGLSSQLSGQNWVTAPPVNGSTNNCAPNPPVVPLDKSLEMPPKKGGTDLSDMHVETPKTDTEEMKNQVTESKHSLSSDIPVPDSGPSWSTNSSLVGSAPQANEVSREWNMYSSAPAKLVDEWDSTLVSASSLKSAEMGSNHAATPTSGPIVHPSQSDNVPDTTGWQAIVAEPNDFSSLAEESVSDLLAEVEAMESLNGLPSPTSILKSGPELAEGGKDDCFSPVEVFSPGPTSGKRDAFSSSSDLQGPSQSTITDEPQGLPNAGRMSSGRSSVSAEAEAVEDQKHSDVSVNQWKPGTSSSISGPMHPRASWEAGHTSNTWMAPSVTTQSNHGALPGNANLGWVGANHGNAALDWDPRNGAVVGNGNANLGAASGNQGILGNQPRYGNSGSRYASPRERAYQGSDSGFNRGRSGWSRQYPGSGGSGGYRQPPKGQQLCKFYERGYCKRGASCSYWHP
ncbi:hypothetical protein BT93_J1630 [Corymbia citriodora subsp. variegata]|nr:hypothetical protein BT93_J1630 [Corymbia citriodora subsp. variegata]